MVRRAAAVMGVGATELTRHSQLTAADVALAASLAALEDAGIPAADLDGYVGCPEAPNPSAAHTDGVDGVSARFMAEALGLRELNTLIDLPQSALAIGLLNAACMAIQSGQATRVLVVRAMYHDDSIAYSFDPRRHAGGQDQFSLPFGLGKGGGIQALWWQRYLQDYSLGEDALYPVIENARRNAVGNPRSYWAGKDVPTQDAYLRAPYVYSPIRVLDCDIPVTGAVAFVVAREDIAKGGPNPPAYVHGFANRQVSSTEKRSRLLGASAAEVESWQLYDGFSVLMVDSVERMGLCPSGEGTAYIKDVLDEGRVGFINSFGGSIGEGRMHGAGHLLEAVLSISPRSWRNRSERVSLAAADIGMWDHGAAVLLGSNPR